MACGDKGAPLPQALGDRPPKPGQLQRGQEPSLLEWPGVPLQSQPQPTHPPTHVQLPPRLPCSPGPRSGASSGAGPLAQPQEHPQARPPAGSPLGLPAELSEHSRSCCRNPGSSLVQAVTPLKSNAEAQVQVPARHDAPWVALGQSLPPPASSPASQGCCVERGGEEHLGG